MNLNRALADIQIDGDNLVGLAVHHHCHHFALARRELVVAAANHLHFPQLLTIFRVLSNGLLDLVEQFLFPVGLLHKVHSALLHGLYRHGYVAVAGDKNDRENGGHGVKLAL